MTNGFQQCENGWEVGRKKKPKCLKKKSNRFSSHSRYIESANCIVRKMSGLVDNVFFGPLGLYFSSVDAKRRT